jgi:hypothetical protein
MYDIFSPYLYEGVRVSTPLGNGTIESKVCDPHLPKERQIHYTVKLDKNGNEYPFVESQLKIIK